MVFTVCFWASFAVMLGTCVVLVRRGMPLKLALFTLFVFAMTAQQLILGFNFTTGQYVKIESEFAPWMAAFQAAAGVEAFAWLTVSLVNFKRHGAWMFAAFTITAVSWERFTSTTYPGLDPMIAQIMELERRVGIALGVAMVLGVIAFGLLGAPASPKWHAFCLVGLSVGSSLGWENGSAKTVMLSVIVALTIWCNRVRDLPNWKSPPPEGDYPTEEIDKGWRRFDRKAES